MGQRNTELRDIRGTFGDYRLGDINAKEVFGQLGLQSKLKSLTGIPSGGNLGSISGLLAEHETNLDQTLKDIDNKRCHSERA